MKRTFLMIAAAAMMLAGCGSSAARSQSSADPSASASAQTENATGAYAVNADLKAQKLPDDAEKAFEKAMENLTGAAYEPLVLLGRQIVSGTNYAVLCKSTAATLNSEPTLSVVTVYEDLEGNCEILSIVPFDLASVAGEDNIVEKEEGMAGAFEASFEYEVQVSDDVMKAVETADAADKNAADIVVTPAVELGSQVVSGTNYAILAKVETKGEDESASWAVVTVYVDLEGKSQITNVYEFDAGAFTDYAQYASETAQAE